MSKLEKLAAQLGKSEGQANDLALDVLALIIQKVEEGFTVGFSVFQLGGDVLPNYFPELKHLHQVSDGGDSGIGS